MQQRLDLIANASQPITLILCAGFEQRAPRAAALLDLMGIRPTRLLLLTYGGAAHEGSYRELAAICARLSGPACYFGELRVGDIEGMGRFLEPINREALVIVDITGLSRIAMMVTLSLLRERRFTFWLLYTEADEYYPRFSEFQELLSEDLNDAFFKLVEYEDAAVVYSAHCDVEEVPGFEGSLLPNYPLMLVAFLTFKRSRLSAVLRAYEANTRVLIKSVPVRPDLQWRERALEIINFDLIDENKSSVRDLETLDWRTTYRFLHSLYATDHNQYRYNFLVAPLGSKMQTVGAWAFATQNRQVRLVTSTPKDLFPEKYSIGFRDTFLIDDLPRLLNNPPARSNTEGADGAT